MPSFWRRKKGRKRSCATKLFLKPRSTSKLSMRRGNRLVNQTRSTTERGRSYR
ncbi:putative clathrin light chain 2 [Iris pallida]|uniref:Clathrin light chain 2 n=1 Tax=Iris pallida TaxID=29817 RepID=A0AAX6IIQ0_IRIPA|nr:putative clathrin light chain 2 [Iris pallida]